MAEKDAEMADTGNIDNLHNDNSKDNKTTPSTQQRRITSRNPQWTYFKLQLVPHSSHPIKNLTIEPLTARTYLTSALSQFLGLMGTSISMDILKIENGDESMKSAAAATATATASGFPIVWIRVPRDDGAAVFAALSSWTGALSSIAGATAASHVDYGEDAESGVAWRICAKGNYLGAIVHGSGQELFRP